MLSLPDPEYRLRFDGRLYSGVIPYRYTNGHSEAVAVAACGKPYPPWLERWDGARWLRAYEPVRQLCSSPPLVVSPGETVSDALRVVAGAPGTQTYPQFTAARIPGRYRLVWGVADVAPPGAARNAVGALRPERERTSDPFELRVDDP